MPTIAGYDDDRREVTEIPEALSQFRWFFERLLEVEEAEGAPHRYFGRLEPGMLTIYAVAVGAVPPDAVRYTKSLEHRHAELEAMKQDVHARAEAERLATDDKKRLTALNHLTLTSGHMRAGSPRSEVGREVVAVLRPLLRRGGGPIPNTPGWYLHTLGVPDPETGKDLPGALYFQFASEPGLSKRPSVMAYACWDAAHSAAAWHSVASACAVMPGTPAAAAQPPAAPWLAVLVTPFAAFDTLHDPSLLPMFGDLERCVAWTAIEMDGR